MNKILVFLIKLIIILSLFWYITKDFDLVILKKEILKFNILILFILFTIYFINVILSTLKWNVILQSLNLNIKFSNLFNTYIIGNFFSNFLPTSFGGDGYRILKYRNEDFSKIFSSVILERLFGLILLVFFAGYYFLYKMEYLLILYSAFAFFCYIKRVWLFDKLVHISCKIKLFNKYKKYNENIYMVLTSNRVINYSLFYSFLFLLLSVLYFWLIFYYLGYPVDFLLLFLIYSASQLLGILPLSVGGFGASQGALILLLSQNNIPAEVSFVVSVIAYLTVLLATSFGGLLYLNGSR